MEYNPINIEKPEVSNTSSQTIIIIILSLLLLFSFLGINIFYIIGQGIDNLSHVLNPAMGKISDSTGTLLNITSDAVTNAAKTGLDITNASVQNIGNLLKTADDHLPQQYSEPSPAPSESPIHKPIGSQKSGWCLVGEFQEKRGCIAVTDQDKCLSGQIFPDQATCLKPNINALQTPNVY